MADEQSCRAADHRNSILRSSMCWHLLLVLFGGLFLVTVIETPFLLDML